MSTIDFITAVRHSLARDRRVWTARHYRVPLAGSIAAGLYAGGMRWACWYLGLHEPPIWAVALVGQAFLWLGVYLARLAWFDRGN
jgi:hypothetical protein